MRLIIQPDYDSMSKWAAYYVASCIKHANPTPEKPFVLGCPTGSSPIGLYKELVKLNKDGVISFKNVVTFNMDEYCGIPRDHEQSYHTFMWKNFFSHIDILPENVNILDGNAENLQKECDEFEKKMESYGGVDLFIGGVGPDGHIAFNEPGSALASRTRIKTLTRDTIIANSRFFGNDISLVPKTALTVGVGTVMAAKKILLLVSGHNKALALHYGIEEGVNHMWTISALQNHPKAVVVCDDDACEELKVKTYRYFKEIEEQNLEPEIRIE